MDNFKALLGEIDRFSPSDPTQCGTIFSHPVLGADSAFLNIITRLFPESNSDNGGGGAL